MRPVTVYLDSSDYSLLSDPKRLTVELSSVLAHLQQWSNEGSIACWFSGAHLSEMAPLDSVYIDAAQRRANLLVELCGTKALISPDRLLAQELRSAVGMDKSTHSIFSSEAEWYPDGVADISPIGHVEMAGNINDAIRDLGLNRKARRLAEQKALKAGKPRAALKTSLVENARNGSLTEILDKYPMRPEDARMLGRFVVGDATARQATDAFLGSLRDPRWMMKWFAQHHQQLTPFIEWTRGPAASMVAGLTEMTTFAAELHDNDARHGTALAKDLNLLARWLDNQDALVSRVATRLANVLLKVDVQALSSDTVDKCCPGLSVCIRVLHSAWGTTLSETPRRARLSDFPDALHAMYAPYVDIFRADSFMSPYIAQRATTTKTHVVAKLAQLPNAIRAAMLAAGEVNSSG